MNAQEIIEYIRTSEKKTPVRAFLQETKPVEFPNAQVFAAGSGTKIVFGDWKDIGPVLEAHAGDIAQLVIENDCRNSAIPMLDLKPSTSASSRARSSGKMSRSAITPSL